VVRGGITDGAAQPPRPVREAADDIVRLAPDCCPVIAYGGLIPPAVLAIAPRGWINLHFSILPAWRGAAPVQHAIRHGDDITGATTFLLDEGMDTGPTLGMVTEPVRPDDTTGALLARLAASGGDLLVRTLDAWEDGLLVPVPQAVDGVSYAPKWSVEIARITWTEPSHGVDRGIRASTPSPGAWTTWRGERIRIGPVRVLRGAEALAPGEIRDARSEVHVGTATDPVALGTVTPAGKREMVAADWLRGVRPLAGEAFT
jgi:methionyl-tRNA formyltransferase